MPNKPKKWLAALLSFFVQPIGLMYVGQIRWAGIYILIALAIGVVGEFYLHQMTIAASLMQLLLALTCAVHAYRLAAKYPEEKPRPGYSRWYGLLGALIGFFSVTFGIRAFIAEPFRFPSGSMLPTIPVRSHLIVQKWGYGNYGTHGLTLFHASISSSLRHGDIIVFEFPLDRSLHYVKRLIGLPGDRIEYRAKRLIINGQPVETRQTGQYEYVARDLNVIRANSYVETLDGNPHAILVQPELPSVMADHVANFPQRERCQFDESGFVCKVPEGHYWVMGDNRDSSNDSRYWGFVPSANIVGKVLHILP